jgi:hypothetical protein
MLTRILEAIHRPRASTDACSPFYKFLIWNGELEPGFIIDFPGQRISTSFYAPSVKQGVQPTYPSVSEEIFEWAALLESVLQSGDTFTMIEAGAGYGRWLVGAVSALRCLGRKTRTHLVAIEPEPTHFFCADLRAFS